MVELLFEDSFCQLSPTIVNKLNKEIYHSIDSYY